LPTGKLETLIGPSCFDYRVVHSAVSRRSETTTIEDYWWLRARGRPAMSNW
jgi:hypothetical protein